MLATSEGSLFGRSIELDQIASLIERHRFVTLTGPGGSGKTSLARVIVERRGAGMSALVDLSAVTSSERVASSIAAALQVAETGDLDGAAAIAAWAAQGTERLLVLDNLEQVDGAREPIEAMLSGSPSLRVLATSRIPLRAAGESEVPIAPLALPADDRPAEVEASPAGALFLARARALGQLVDLDVEAARTVAALCRRLDGLPLALELAAARTRILTPTEMLTRLDARDATLLRRSTGDARQRSLAEVIDWSIGLLADNDRAVLAAIATATGRFDMELAEALAPDADVLDALDALVSFGLVVRDGEAGGKTRFRLLETVRAAAATNGDEPRRRLAAAMFKRVDDLAGGIEGEHGDAALARLDADADNLQAAIDWATANDPALALALAAVAYPYWAVRGRLRDARDTLQGLLDLAPPDAPFRARAIGGLSRIAAQLGGHMAGYELGAEAARLGREMGDVEAEVEGLQAIVWTAFERNDIVGDDQIRAARDRALEIIVDAPPPRRFRARQVVLTALVQEHGMSADEVMEQLGEAIADAEASHNVLGLAKLRGNRALNHIARGEFEASLRDATTSAAGFASLGDEYHEGWARNTVIIAAAGVGDVDTFRAATERSRQLAVASGSPYEMTDLVVTVATGAVLLGRPRDAARLFGLAEFLTDQQVETMPTIWNVPYRWPRPRSL